MLRKFNRRKSIRKNFNTDIIYKGLLLDKANQQEKKVLTTSKIAQKWFDDDLFCNILIQKDKFFMNKLTGHQTKRLFPFYPSFIPLIDSKTILSKEEYYWTANTIEYPCIRCNNPTISFLGDFKLKNVLCGNCIEDHYINKMGRFDKHMHNHEYSKYQQNFYIINKEHQSMIFNKLIKRERSLYINDKTILKSVKRVYTNKLNHIEKIFNSLLG